MFCWFLLFYMAHGATGPLASCFLKTWRFWSRDTISSGILHVHTMFYRNSQSASQLMSNSTEQTNGQKDKRTQRTCPNVFSSVFLLGGDWLSVNLHLQPFVEIKNGGFPPFRNYDCRHAHFDFCTVMLLTYFQPINNCFCSYRNFAQKTMLHCYGG